MFSKIVLLSQAKTTAARLIFLLGCIAVLALQGPGVARAQDSDVRTELLKALELQSGVAEILGRADLAASLDEAIEQLLFASDADLGPLEGAFDAIQNYSEALQRLDAAIQEAVAAGEAQFAGTLSAPILRPPELDGVVLQLTSPEYFQGGFFKEDGILCNPVLFPNFVFVRDGIRIDTGLVITASLAVGAAKGFWALIQSACANDTIGIIASIGCIATNVSVVIAEEILDVTKDCNATVTVARLDAAFFRAEDNFILGSHIHEDLEEHVGDLDDIKDATDAIAAALAQHDVDIKALLAGHEAALTAKFAALMEVQLEAIRLLTTPTGQRSTNTLACAGGPCDFPNK